ncbi:unnamed protein product [Mycena citricolor]|uniref:Uncharacterized protein n=1 Tax=Mycena citricolor TaxID=2018698 RepID=A0AAD2HPW9_9AGAR|nr:unnamed protein product [Mycena citricolor]
MTTHHSVKGAVAGAVRASKNQNHYQEASPSAPAPSLSATAADTHHRHARPNIDIPRNLVHAGRRLADARVVHHAQRHLGVDLRHELVLQRGGGVRRRDDRRGEGQQQRGEQGDHLHLADGDESTRRAFLTGGAGGHRVGRGDSHGGTWSIEEDSMFGTSGTMRGGLLVAWRPQG